MSAFVSKSPSFLKLMRPKQWTKNLFVLSPLIFSGKWNDPGSIGFALLATLAFILASGAVYAINDSADAEEDRHHPKKKDRPVAAGKISVGEARGFAAALALGALGLSLALGWPMLVLTAGYLLLNLGYSLKLKEFALVDVIVIASGFLLRVGAGCVAIAVTPSVWILLCTAFLSLFIALVKRRKELNAANSNETRKAMAGYSAPLLDQFITCTMSITIIVYLLYGHFNHNPWFLFTGLFVVYGLFRYLHILYFSDTAERPEDAVFADAPLMANVLLWGASCLMFLAWEKATFAG